MDNKGKTRNHQANPTNLKISGLFSCCCFFPCVSIQTVERAFCFICSFIPFWSQKRSESKWTLFIVYYSVVLLYRKKSLFVSSLKFLGYYELRRQSLGVKTIRLRCSLSASSISWAKLAFFSGKMNNSSSKSNPRLKK